MIDGFGRIIDYLRVSVTDRCNLRCRYCIQPDEVKWLRHDEIVTFEEIIQVVKIAVGMGMNKVRLTGGEPLVRRDICTLVAEIARIDGVDDLALSTNGVLLEQMAFSLARAGLKRVNVSLDTTDAERFRDLTRGGDISRVFAGIAAAKAAGLEPIKLNCVVGGPCQHSDLLSVQRYAIAQKLELRTIPFMDFAAGRFSVISGSSRGDCSRCNRLRLSSDASIRPCLFSDLSFSIRELGVERALRLAIELKPESGGRCSHNWMHGIGG
ncbi:MAG: radical SAM protein [Deltaproteobacteria bacterium]|nr:radical SAM protein [Deltaproteobacteria bacterium]